MHLNIQPITAYTPEHYKLLLDADPSLSSIATYLSRSNAFEFTDGIRPLGIIVAMQTAPQTVEIMNIAVHPELQNQHLGSQLIKYIIEQYASDPDFKKIEVKTGSTSFKQLYIYQKLGFRCSSILTDHFQNQDLYPKDIFENNLLLRDAIVLEKKI